MFHSHAPPSQPGAGTLWGPIYFVRMCKQHQSSGGSIHIICVPAAHIYPDVKRCWNLHRGDTGNVAFFCSLWWWWADGIFIHSSIHSFCGSLCPGLGSLWIAQ